MKNRLVINPNYYVGYILHILTRNSLNLIFSLEEGLMNISDDQKKYIGILLRNKNETTEFESVSDMVKRIGEVKTRELINKLIDYAEAEGFYEELNRVSKSYSLSNKKLRRNEEF